MNPVTKARSTILGYIDETTNLPDHIKPQAKEMVSSIMRTIPLYLGHLELLWRREMDHRPAKKRVKYKGGL